MFKECVWTGRTNEGLRVDQENILIHMWGWQFAFPGKVIKNQVKLAYWPHFHR